MTGPSVSTADSSTTTRQFGVRLYPNVPFPKRIEQSRWVASLKFDISGFVTTIPDDIRLDAFERMARETIPSPPAR